MTDPVSLRLMRGHPAHLKERGWQVHVVAGGAAPAVDGAVGHSVPMRRNPSPLLDLVALVRWMLLIRRLRPDVVMVGTPKAGLLGTVAAFVCRVPRRIYLLRGLRLEGMSGPALWLLSALELVACRLATDVLAVSPSLADETRARRLTTAGSIQVLGPGSSNGVDTSEFVPPTIEQRRTARQSLGLSMDSRVVGFVGRLHADKGIDTLVSALENLQFGAPLVLLLAGSVEDDEVGRDIEARLLRSGIQTVMLGHVEEPLRIFWAMDLLVLPSRREGFPNVVLEAAACGVPAVVTDATGCRDSVVDRRTGRIVPVDSPEELAAALRSVLVNREELAELGAAARARASTDFERQLVWERIDHYLSPGGTTHQRQSKSVGAPSRRVDQ